MAETPEAPAPDLTAPVVLQEPERPGGDAWAAPDAVVGVPSVAASPVVGLHPGWAAVIAPGERVVWQGQPRAQAGLGGLGRGRSVSRCSGWRMAAAPPPSSRLALPILPTPQTFTR